MNYLVRSEAALAYECGFSCDNGIFLRLGSEAFFITDGRYTVEAGESVRHAMIVEARDIVRKAAMIIRSSRIRRVAADPGEWSAADWATLEMRCNARVAKRPEMSRLARAVKREDEVALLRKAAEEGRAAFDAIAALIPGMTGKSEKSLYRAAREILTARGEREVSFDPIVALNANSAKPHARPGDERLAPGDHLLLDAGVKVGGYCSDRTRCAIIGETAHFGLEQRYDRSERQKVYDLVRAAHDAAIAAARPGMKACELDAVARRVIEAGGYARQFVHSLGHGVGLEIHEYPSISSRSRAVLEEGMVFTIEPGIYLPGDFGVRIEDMVVMRADGVDVL